MTAVSTMPGAPFLVEVLRFQLRMRTLTVLPPYKGAVLRGALDNAFRRLACPLPRSHCDQCDLHEQCIYMAMFHPAPPKDFPDAGKYKNGPPPYVLKPSADNRQVYHPQDSLEFDLTLIGRALHALPYFIFAFDQIGRRGLGLERGLFQLHQVGLHRNGNKHLLYDHTDQTLRPIPPVWSKQPQKTSPATTITLNLHTPVRVKQDGKLVTRLDFPVFFNSLTQRISLLSTFYGQGLPPELQALQIKACHITTVEDETFWYDWPRYSTRQRELMKFGGLRGKITFEGDLTPYTPWLKIGELVHVGQTTTFGLGGYAIS